MKKQVISIVLLLVMCIQLLPLTQVSTAMYQSQQMNEEMPHNDEPVSPVFTEELHKQFVSAGYEQQMELTELHIAQMIHQAEKISSRLSDDVQTQPPNC